MQDVTVRPVGTADYITNYTGKMMGRTMSSSNLILLTPLEDKSRGMLLAHEVLGQQLRIQGLDVIRLQINEIDLLREKESKIFISAEN
jgi:hypothetical protein